LFLLSFQQWSHILLDFYGGCQLDLLESFCECHLILFLNKNE
jgi:hypothetical protein